LLNTLIGTALMAASSSALNQYLERDADAKMRRTESRPLPAGRVEPHQAFWFGVVTALVGCAYLAVAANLLCAILAWLTWFVYLFVYTPMKTESAFNTVMGAIPGAIPPVIGWVAARGTLSDEALVLFGILFFWQFPHFYAIAWLYRDDYQRGGFKMLSGLDRGDVWTGRCMVLGGIALLAVSLLPTALGLTGITYLVGALILGLAFLACSLLCMVRSPDEFARRTFFASVIYLPLLLALMTLNKI
jgi:protoheme IX farnesyltransferase